jgi:DNA mismatch endonuclease (patch repair protein)
LPGTPDLAFIARRKVIFVNGCFWHSHKGCAGYRLPKSNRGFWKEKHDRNRARDRSALATLRHAGWDTLVVWECETRDLEALSAKLSEFLTSVGGSSTGPALDKARRWRIQ